MLDENVKNSILGQRTHLLKNLLGDQMKTSAILLQSEIELTDHTSTGTTAYSGRGPRRIGAAQPASTYCSIVSNDSPLVDYGIL